MAPLLLLRGVVVAASDQPSMQELPIEVERYPEIRRVIETQEPLIIKQNIETSLRKHDDEAHI